MKVLYIDCGMGAAGDMLTAALLNLLPDREAFISRMNALGLPGVTISCTDTSRAGIGGLSMQVLVGDTEETSEDVDVADVGVGCHGHHHHHGDDDHHHHGHDEAGHHHHHGADDHHHHGHDEAGHHHHHGADDHHHHGHDEAGHHHHHTSLADIEALVRGLAVPEAVRSDILSVYRIIAEAESTVHGVPAAEIHFHEVGSLDAVADITAVCLLMHEIGAGKILASPIHVGSGHVRCAHGILPVPAPATALILSGLPIYTGQIHGELCTPTGAALLRHFVSSFGPMPVMRVEKIGYGMGKKDFPVLNAVRVLLGETEDMPTDQIARLECNVDDMTAEEIGFAMEGLLSEGARDVFTTPVGMKKNRPGTLITVICSPRDRDRMVRAIFRLTSTIGIREVLCDRYILSRSIETVDTPFGPVRRKVSSGYGVRKYKYEYDDLADLAASSHRPLSEIKAHLKNGPEA